MSTRDSLGGIIHTYQKYDPAEFPSPTTPPPDLVSPAFDHLLTYGNMRRLTPEELANAVHLDPSQIRGLGPSIEALQQILEERKRRILETYETDKVQGEARGDVPGPGREDEAAAQARQGLQRGRPRRATPRPRTPVVPRRRRARRVRRGLLKLVERLGDKYQVDELADKYEFTGDQSMTVPEALEIKKELETIDKLLEQLEEAAKTAQIGIIDMEELSKFAEPGDVRAARRPAAADPGVPPPGGRAAGPRGGRARRLPDDAQGVPAVPVEVALDASSSRCRRRRRAGTPGPIIGEGAVEMQQTRPYEFGD